jgi:hypothetical protein
MVTRLSSPGCQVIKFHEMAALNSGFGCLIGRNSSVQQGGKQASRFVKQESLFLLA